MEGALGGILVEEVSSGRVEMEGAL